MKTVIIIILLTLSLAACSGSGLPETAEDALDGSISNISRYNNPDYDIVSVFEVGEGSEELWCVLTSGIQTNDLREDNSGFYKSVSHFVVYKDKQIWIARPIHDDIGNGISGQSIFEDLGCDNWTVDDEQ